MKHWCHNCCDVVDPIEEDHGGPEEFWGATVHHEQLVDVCPECKEEVEEMTEQEIEDLLALHHKL